MLLLWLRLKAMRLKLVGCWAPTGSFCQLLPPSALTSRVPRSTEGDRTPVWIEAQDGRTAENRAAAAVNGAETRCRKLMEVRQGYARKREAAKTAEHRIEGF